MHNGSHPNSDGIPQPERAPKVTLTQNQVDEIKELGRGGMRQTAIAKLFESRGVKIGQPRISAILSNKKYRKGKWVEITPEDKYGDVSYSD